MNTMATCADGFIKSFSNQSELLDFLRGIDGNTVWDRKKANELRFEALIPESEKVQQLTESYRQRGMEDVINDTQKNAKLLLNVNGATYPVRRTAFKTIFERARVSGNSLTEIPREQLAEVLNYCMDVAKGQALIKHSEEKVCAVHAGGDSDYAILEISELFSRTAEFLAREFPKNTFLGASFEHAFVTGAWSLCDDSLLDSYRQALIRHGLPASGLKAAVRLSTSDVGTSGANLYPTLMTANNRSVTLGHNIKLAHKDGATLDDFDEKLKMIFPQCEAALERLANLLNVDVRYPKNAMLAVMKHIGIPKKLSFETVALFIAQNGEGACTAHEIYYGIAEAVFQLQSEGASGTKIVELEDKVARALNVKWPDFDMPMEYKW